MQENKYLGVGLGFVAGYVDTVGFVSLFGLFTAHVTGNFVLIGSELVNPGHGVLIKFLAFPAFVAGIVLTRLLLIRLHEQKLPTLGPVLGMQIAFLLAFMVLGWMAQPILEADTWAALSAGIAGAAAMGVQNAASRLVFTDIAPTTVMTGNVTQLVIDLLDYMRAENSGEISKRINKFLWPVLAFGTGAIGGAFACMYWQFWSLLIPIIILACFIPWTASMQPRS